MRLSVLLLLGLLTSQDQPDNPVDQILDTKWQELNLTPVPRSTDEEFLRRVMLDLNGTIPQSEDVLAFKANFDPEKRTKLIDMLLDSSAWTEFWADRLASTLISYRTSSVDVVLRLKDFLRMHLERNTPYNKVVEEIISAKGYYKDGATAFVSYWLQKDQSRKELTIQVAKVFLGIQLQCAQCHDHPFEKWTKDDFYSMVANFAATSYREVRRMERRIEGESEVVEASVNNGLRPEGYKVNLPPRFIDGRRMSSRNTRAEFARLVAGPANSQFARATVNRIWSMFMGQGFVEPVEDFSTANQPSLPDLLDRLSREFVEKNYDLKWLMRTIATSRAYQLTSRRARDQFPEAARRFYVYQSVRPMAPDQMVAAFNRATGVTADSRGRRGAMSQFARGSGFEPGGNPNEYSANVQQVMRLMNMDSPLYRGSKAKGGGALAEILKLYKDPKAIFNQIYLRVLSRLPTEEEHSLCMNYFQDKKRAVEAYEDIFFVLLNSNEFYFNH